MDKREERLESVTQYLAAAIGAYEAEEEDLREHGGEDDTRELCCFEARGHLEQVGRMLGVEDEVLRSKEIHKELRARILAMQRDHPEQREFIRKHLKNQ